MNYRRIVLVPSEIKKKTSPYIKKKKSSFDASSGYIDDGKGHYLPDPKSAVPNPIRNNYDYSGELGGPEWQNRVKNFMKKRKERKAKFEAIHVRL